VAPGSSHWCWITAFFDRYLPALAEGGFLSTKERQAFEADWAKRSTDKTTRLMTPPMLHLVGAKF
jgi:hypothetical protein